MENPELAFDPEAQRAAAKEVLKTNKRIAKIIGINPCDRGTCLKPEGTSSCMLGTCSGIGEFHSEMFFRNVQ
jgi:ribonucleoside-diphosphate reductase alpha chain